MEKLLNYDNVRLAGLGARDTLRLEAGLCLYGNDLTEDITPVEASLTWCIGTLCMYLLYGGEIATTCRYNYTLYKQFKNIKIVIIYAGRRRKTDGGFLGSDVILQQLKNKPKRRRVGLTSQGPPARQGTLVVDSSGQSVGGITSGCPSPTLGVNIAMAYVAMGHFKTGTKLDLKIRKNVVGPTVTKMPFVPAQYHTKV